LRFKFYPEGKRVFNEGDHGDKFYIIVEGTCSVLIPVRRDKKAKAREREADHERMLNL